MQNTFNNYKEIIKKTDYANKKFEDIDTLTIQEVDKIKISYAPFDYINKDAKVVICGITPGFTQAINALTKASELLNYDNVLQEHEILKEVKKCASFSGAMRDILINMLDDIELNEFLNLESCEELFDTREDLIHYTSLLRNPVFINGKNYSGSGPKILKNKLLESELENFKNEISVLSDNTIYIPLGKRVEEVFKTLLKDETVQLDESQVLFGLPHPSPANGWRKRHFVQNKNDLLEQIKSLSYTKSN
ncbi:uracil-DNA glycosylase family protein [Sulfurovum sp. AR]|uniref:uracil-DNA glycosylase family protein n=1 Tax=Sulfurovum sp. AR TaxID=1165841 RepID=UPI00025C4CBB|nr:uracil-DNA glycosylase family protein [Sulfurovum sp. AR]EIF51363.1 hypothetical protein SULAR_03927 [Sulfurovum sp. AR]